MSSVSPQSDTPVLTTDGRQRLQERLDHATEELAGVEDHIKSGQAGDEEFANRRRLEDQVDDLRRVLERAADVATVDEDPSIVEIGDEVDVEDDDGDLATYAIVHPFEANADRNRISAASPLGRALLGARPGDRVTVEAPAGSYECLIRARRRLT